MYNLLDAVGGDRVGEDEWGEKSLLGRVWVGEVGVVTEYACRVYWV